jgi:hypothetical protein
MNTTDTNFHFTELVQFGINQDYLVQLNFKDTFAKKRSHSNKELFVEIIPLIIDGTNKFGSDTKSVWRVYVDNDRKTVEFGYCEGHHLFHEGSFKYKQEELRGKGLGTYILSRLIEMSKINYSDYGFHITIKSLDFKVEHETLERWYENFGLRGGLPNSHKLLVKDLKEVKSKQNINILYSSKSCYENCIFRSELESSELKLNQTEQELKYTKQKLLFYIKRSEITLYISFIGLISISTCYIFKLTPLISLLAVIGFVTIIVNLFFWTWKVINLKKINQ